MTIGEISGNLSLNDMQTIAAGLNTCSLVFAGQVGPGVSGVGYLMELAVCHNGDVIILGSNNCMARLSPEQIANRRDCYEPVGEKDLTGDWGAGLRNYDIRDINRATRLAATSQTLFS